MSHELFPILEKKALNTPHFPTKMQCFIFRNWEMVEPDVLAKVLGCTKEQVIELAKDMGLDVNAPVITEFLKKGYISIIRANWHLCSYEQLMTLVDTTLTSRTMPSAPEANFLPIMLEAIKGKQSTVAVTSRSA